MMGKNTNQNNAEAVIYLPEFECKNGLRIAMRGNFDGGGFKVA
jgi:hypothetical protein